MTIALYTVRYFLALMIAKKPSAKLLSVTLRLKSYASSKWLAFDVSFIIATLLYFVNEYLATWLWLLSVTLGTCFIIQDINEGKRG